LATHGMKYIDDRVAAKKIFAYMDNGGSLLDACIYMQKDLDKYSPTMRIFIDTYVTNDIKLKDFLGNVIASTPTSPGGKVA